MLSLHFNSVMDKRCVVDVPYIHQQRGIRLSRSEYKAVVMSVLDVVPGDRLKKISYCQVPLELEELVNIRMYFCTLDYHQSTLNASVKFCWEVMGICSSAEISIIKAKAGCWGLMDFPPLCHQQRLDMIVNLTDP